jgi:hypothetical protein
MTVMSHTTAPSPVRRLVLVPAGTTTPSRGDELVRRYRLARLRLAGREAADIARRDPPARST